LVDRRLRAGRHFRARARCDAQRGEAPDRLPLSLCLRHADRRGFVHHLVHVFGGGSLAMNWPILSVTTFLPLLGALLIMFMARGSTGLANGTARWVAFWTTLATFAVSLVMVWR